jgi:hypothetical protein
MGMSARMPSLEDFVRALARAAEADDYAALTRTEGGHARADLR